LKASGADIVDRAAGRFPVRDFLSDAEFYPNILTNPPTARAVEIVEHGLCRVVEGGRVAVLVPLGFAQRRFSLFTRPEFDTVLFLSRRPSMPPGELLLRYGESVRRGGSVDYCWTVWQQGRGRWRAFAGWLPP
jgi:hypothetical protein